MMKCERCGMEFGPMEASILRFCPHCKAQDQIESPLIVPLVKDPGEGQADRDGIGSSENAAYVHRTKDQVEDSPKFELRAGRKSWC